MAALTYDISYDERRSRLTNAFRLILVIPHLIVVGVWGYLAEILAFIQWFIIVFTGKRNEALWDLQWAGSPTPAGQRLRQPDVRRVPAVRHRRQGTVPVSIDLAYEEPASRLTNGLRFIWAIPALLIAILIGIAFVVVVFISWFAIVITGKHPAACSTSACARCASSLQRQRLRAADDRHLPEVGVGRPGLQRQRRPLVVHDRLDRCHSAAGAAELGTAGEPAGRDAAARRSTAAS